MTYVYSTSTPEKPYIFVTGYIRTHFRTHHTQAALLTSLVMRSLSFFSAVKYASVDGQLVGNGVFVYQRLGNLNVILVEFRGMGCPVVAGTYH
jgi:hypothetical protein